MASHASALRPASRGCSGFRTESVTVISDWLNKSFLGRLRRRLPYLLGNDSHGVTFAVLDGHDVDLFRLAVGRQHLKGKYIFKKSVIDQHSIFCKYLLFIKYLALEMSSGSVREHHEGERLADGDARIVEGGQLKLAHLTSGWREEHLQLLIVVCVFSMFSKSMPSIALKAFKWSIQSYRNSKTNSYCLPYLKGTLSAL